MLSTEPAPNRIYTMDHAGIGYFSGAGTASWQVQLFENGGPGDKVIIRMTATNGSNSFTSGIQGVQPTYERGSFAELARTVRSIAQSAKMPMPLAGLVDQLVKHLNQERMKALMS